MVQKCTLCDQFFKSLRVLNIHQASCKFKQVIINRTNQDIITKEVFVNENIVVGTSTIAKSEEIDIEIEMELKWNLHPYTNASSIVKSTTNNLNGHAFVETIHRVYDEIEKTFSSFLLGMKPKCPFESSHHGLNIFTVTRSVSQSYWRYTWYYHHFFLKSQLVNLQKRYNYGSGKGRQTHSRTH